MSRLLTVPESIDDILRLAFIGDGLTFLDLLPQTSWMVIAVKEQLGSEKLRRKSG